MSANRIIPYGYEMKNGRYAPHPQESIIVQRIFNEYLSGKSLLQIAKKLTYEKEEFTPGRFDWNKNRIKRILEDKRYLGGTTYPPIVSEDIYHQVQTIKKSNNNCRHKNEPCLRLPCTVECDLCGTEMNRRHDSRRKASKELWTCKNPDCRNIVNIDDEVLKSKITAILNRMIADPNSIKHHEHILEPSMEIRRLQGEINHRLDGFEPDRDFLKTAIFQLAALRYNAISTDDILSDILRAVFEQSEPLSSFSPELLKQTVSKIRLGGEISPTLVLKNNQRIGKEYDHADRNNDHDSEYGQTSENSSENSR